jgi:uncharacterized protein YkwD
LDAAPALAQTASVPLKLFLPALNTGGDFQGSGKAPCSLNEAESAIAAAMKVHPNQKRAELVCDSTLAAVARARAKDMAERAYFSHVDPDGHGPNYLVSAAGYDLPDWYDRRAAANNLESIAAGYSNPNQAWSAWMDSAMHRLHILGLNDFYASQTRFGIGFYSLDGSPYADYWVIITAPPEE